jgi:hypothetical protein
LAFHNEIRAIFDKYGMADYFYGAVNLMGDPQYGVAVGAEGNDNNARIFLVKGMLVEISQHVRGSDPLEYGRSR